MKIAIFGGNGYSGEAIRAEAVRRGHDVTVVSRSGRAANIDAIEHTRAGDIHDAALVDEVTADNDAVIVAIPGFEIEGKKLSEAVPGLLVAAERDGVRVGVVGGSGTLRLPDGSLLMDSAGFPPPALPSSRGAAEVLEVLTSSHGGDWFYVSPPLAYGARSPQEPAGAYLVGGDSLITDSVGGSRLSAEDLARAIVDELETPTHRNRRFSVVGAY